MEEKTEERQKEELKNRGKKALILNIIFFFVLLAGIFLVVYTNLINTAIIISAIFIVSMLYIYLS